MNSTQSKAVSANVIKFPSDRERNPDDYARKCPHCGGINFVITLTNRLKCYECEEFFEIIDPPQPS